MANSPVFRVKFAQADSQSVRVSKDGKEVVPTRRSIVSQLAAFRAKLPVQEKNG